MAFIDNWLHAYNFTTALKIDVNPNWWLETADILQPLLIPSHLHALTPVFPAHQFIHVFLIVSIAEHACTTLLLAVFTRGDNVGTKLGDSCQA